MGCCMSSPAGDLPQTQSSSSIPQPSHQDHPQTTSPTQQIPPTSSTNSRRRRRDHQRPLDQHIDRPLRPHTWACKNRRWTTAQLARERRDFFDTRVTGRPEVWQTIHTALQVLWTAPANGSNPSGSATDLATAQSILSAAEISLPTGDLANGVYDTLGNYYSLPEHIVCDPVDVIVDDSDDGANTRSSGDSKGGAHLATINGDDDTVDEEDDGEKLKSAVEIQDPINVRARLSENGRDYQVRVGKNTTARAIAKGIAQEASLAPTKKVRLTYMGKMLKENTSLEEQGWKTGHLLNAFVFER